LKKITVAEYICKYIHTKPFIRG